MSVQDLSFSTPMMQQYLEIKQRYPDCLLFFRLGDFFELFLEDAEVGAQILDITLTSRSRGKDGRIPMAGVPFHAVDSYIAKLIKAGYKVALCDQVTPPDGKNLVERDVVRIITPGTVLDHSVLEAKNNNYLLAVARAEHEVGLGILDLTTGECQAHQFDTHELALETLLQQIYVIFEPRECILGSDLFHSPDLQKFFSTHTHMSPTLVPQWQDWTHSPDSTIKQVFSQHSLSTSFLSTQPLAQQVVAALSEYARYTQKSELPHVTTIEPLLAGMFLQMDKSTIANLELTHTLRDGQRQGSFLHTIDYTLSAMGGRLLKHWLLQPLQEIETIGHRLDAVAYFKANPTLRLHLQHCLKRTQDIERLLSRLSLRAGTPRDLKALEQSLLTLAEVPDLFSNSSPPTLIATQLEYLQHPSLSKLQQMLATTIVDDPPVDAKAGGLIHPGIDPELDELRHTVSHSKNWIAELETAERERTGISSLKIKFNQVFGFYIEVSKANLHLVPDTYDRKQTLVNAERFMTPELKQHEEIILTAEEKTNEIEFQIFNDTVQHVLHQLLTLQRAAKSIATLDCLQGLAELAELKHFSRPEMTTTGELVIKNGRHLVVEDLVSSHRFVPNDVILNPTDHQLVLITGPNMAGKSVVMRQVALITLLAHMGSFVPAEAASISLIDQIFVRSGAADMISAGLSTFMVEMTETAHILEHATEKSLVIMDEIGRGTSTYDGISIAWALAEFLISDEKVRPKTLFATHYHELQTLADKYPDSIQNYHMAITEHQGKPVFLYKFKPGAASHSYGVAVAELAGVPAPVIQNAQTILAQLEQTHHSPTSSVIAAAPVAAQAVSPTQPPTTSTKPRPATNNGWQKELAAIDVHQLTPLAAFSQIVKWQQKYLKENT